VTGPSKCRLLFVDDEPSIRDVMEALLYEVSLAENGLAALSQLRTLTPDIIVSDLNMPQMSGFEFLSVVRRRFPEIPVIAISGAYPSCDRVPAGVVADSFYSKSQLSFEKLLTTIADLIQTSATRANKCRGQSAPILDTT
jgi:CheY-like chemotaxis protein